MKDISNKLNITEDKVLKLIKLYNIKKRSKEEINKIKSKIQLGQKRKPYKKYNNRDISKNIIVDLYLNKHLRKEKIVERLNISITHLNKMMKKYCIINRSWKGEQSAFWKGGKNIDNKGRKFVYFPNHPRGIGNYVANAILIKENELGRHIKKDEIVHHKNFDCSDDRKENLLVCSRSAHSKIHGKQW